MTKLTRLLIALLVLSTPIGANSALADGWQLTDGRFPEGEVTVFNLTQHQKDFLELIRLCRNNKKSPFVFRLTKDQSAKLRKVVGFSPTRFAVVDSSKGDDGGDIEMNVIIRFSDSQFEVPHKLLAHGKDAQNWEFKVMGWKPNPLANPGSQNLKACPE